MLASRRDTEKLESCQLLRGTSRRTARTSHLRVRSFLSQRHFAGRFVSYHPLATDESRRPWNQAGAQQVVPGLKLLGAGKRARGPVKRRTYLNSTTGAHCMSRTFSKLEVRVSKNRKSSRLLLLGFAPIIQGVCLKINRPLPLPVFPQPDRPRSAVVYPKPTGAYAQAPRMGGIGVVWVG